MEFGITFTFLLVVFAVVAIAKTARVVPQRSAYVVERLGKYSKTLEAGFHILIPFIDKVAYRHTLKEEVIDVPRQMCVTKDNIQVAVDEIGRASCRERGDMR